MPAGTNKSRWKIAFHPSTGDHVPFTGSSGMVYDSGIQGPVHARLRPATYRFKATLEVRAWNNVPSGAAIVLVESTRPCLHTMQLAEFMRLVPEMIGGRISGEWGYAKVGSNTQIVKVGEMIT